MGYSIYYGPGGPKRKHKATAFGHVGVLIVGVVCALALGFSLPKQAQQLREALFPWTLPESRAAFSELTEQIRHGAPLRDALSDFCAKILDGAYDER